MMTSRQKVALALIVSASAGFAHAQEKTAEGSKRERGRDVPVRRVMPEIVVSTPGECDPRSADEDSSTNSLPPVRPQPARSSGRLEVVAPPVEVDWTNTETAAVELLDRPITEIRMDGVTLEELADWLRDQGPVNVIMLWKALDGVSVDEDTWVSLELRNVTVHDVLAAVCEQLSPWGAVGFQAYGNTIKFSSQDHFNHKMYLRVYDVRDVAFKVLDFKPGCETPHFHIQNKGVPELARVVRHTIAPGRWTEDGGRFSIKPFRFSLVVNAPMWVHEQIAGRFEMQGEPAGS